MNLRHPLFSCGFRPFFVLTTASAVLFLAIWLLALQSALPGLDGWRPPGGVLLWHGHELLYGFGMAAVAGFLLTAVPEFTGAAPPRPGVLAALAGLWLAARVAYAAAQWLPGGSGVVLAGVCNLAFVLALLLRLAAALWRDPARSHLGFAWALGALGAGQAGYFTALLRQADALAWLHVGVDLMMILIVLAGSRVSMNVVNGYIEAGRPGAPPPGLAGYVARPPRRHLAVFCIAACSVAQWLLGGGPVTGWTALAAAAAMLNLLNDWHIGKALFTRWALMLYASYWLVALGYGAMGLAWLTGLAPASSGRHVLMAGAMGLSIFTIMSLAGRIHAGRWLDRRPWVPVAAAVLALAALLRAAAGLPALGAWASWLLLGAGLGWTGVFAAYLWHAWPVLCGPRTDGQQGCAEPLGKQRSPMSRHGTRC